MAGDRFTRSNKWKWISPWEALMLKRTDKEYHKNRRGIYSLDIATAHVGGGKTSWAFQYIARAMSLKKNRELTRPVSWYREQAEPLAKALGVSLNRFDVEKVKGLLFFTNQKCDWYGYWKWMKIRDHEKLAKWCTERTFYYETTEQFIAIVKYANRAITFTDEAMAYLNSLEVAGASDKEQRKQLTELTRAIAHRRKQDHHIILGTQVLPRLLLLIREQCQHVILLSTYFGLFTISVVKDGTKYTVDKETREVEGPKMGWPKLHFHNRALRAFFSTDAIIGENAMGGKRKPRKGQKST